MVSVNFFSAPTLRFQVLYVFLVLAHDRRRILHFGVTAHPTAEWTVQQFFNAFSWDSALPFCCATAIESLARSSLSR
jgi:putative transposase